MQKKSWTYQVLAEKAGVKPNFVRELLRSRGKPPRARRGGATARGDHRYKHLATALGEKNLGMSIDEFLDIVEEWQTGDYKKNLDRYLGEVKDGLRLMGADPRAQRIVDLAAQGEILYQDVATMAEAINSERPAPRARERRGRTLTGPVRLLESQGRRFAGRSFAGAGLGAEHPDRVALRQIACACGKAEHRRKKVFASLFQKLAKECPSSLERILGSQ